MGAAALHCFWEAQKTLSTLSSGPCFLSLLSCQPIPNPSCPNPPSLPLDTTHDSTNLSHSEVAITDLAQGCLSAQQGGQLGLGQQDLQVIGSLQLQLGQRQADGTGETKWLGY